MCQLHLPYIFVRLTPSYNGASIVLFLCLVLSLFVISTCHLPLTQLPPSPIKIVEMSVVNGMLVNEMRVSVLSTLYLDSCRLSTAYPALKVKLLIKVHYSLAHLIGQIRYTHTSPVSLVRMTDLLDIDEPVPMPLIQKRTW